MPIVLPPIADPPADVGFYFTRAELLLEMGQENFDREIRLDPNAVTADEAIVAAKVLEGNMMIDAEGVKLGLIPIASGDNAGHVVPADSEDPFTQIVYAELTAQGAKYCRARCRALRPDADDEPRSGIIIAGTPPPNTGSDTAGGFTKMQNNARARVIEILTEYRARLIATALAESTEDQSIVAVGWNDQWQSRCGRVRYPRPLPPGVDPSILF